MRVVIMADRSFATREQAMLARLEVGLADEGVHVVHAVPAAALERGDGPTTGLYSTRVGYADTGFGVTRRSRVRALAGAIREATPEHLEPGVDAVHVFGTDAWATGAELARQTGAALLLELWRSSAIGEASALATQRLVPGRVGAVRVPMFLVSEPGVEAGLRKRSARALVRSAPWGVHPAGAVRPAFDASRPLAVAVLADTGDPAAAGAVLSGLIEACRGDVPGTVRAEPLVFLGTEDQAAGRKSAIWHAAKKLNMLDRLTLLDDMEARREPILQMDLLIIAEPSGRQRTLALEAMATGIPVLAVTDPYVDSLVDRVTARLVPTPTASSWATLLRELIDDRPGRERLAASAHEFIVARRTAAAQVAAVLAAYQAAIASPARA